jgi:hypothetical protein
MNREEIKKKILEEGEKTFGKGKVIDLIELTSSLKLPKSKNKKILGEREKIAVFFTLDNGGYQTAWYIFGVGEAKSETNGAVRFRAKDTDFWIFQIFDYSVLVYPFKIL